MISRARVFDPISSIASAGGPMQTIGYMDGFMKVVA